MSCGGKAKNNANRAAISAVSKSTGVSNRECQDLFHGLIRVRKEQGTSDQQEAEAWARMHLAQMAEQYASHRAENPDYALATPARATTATAVGSHSGAATATLTAPAPGADPRDPEHAQHRCERCGFTVKAHNITGLCRDCLAEELTEEARLMGMSPEQARDWGQEQADLNDLDPDELDDFDEPPWRDDATLATTYDTGEDPWDDDPWDDDARPRKASRWDGWAFGTGSGGGTRYGYDEDEESVIPRGSSRSRPRSSSTYGYGLFGGYGYGSGRQGALFDARPSHAEKAKETGQPVTVPMGRNGSGDGYIYFPDGTRRWGVYGAAGILMRHVDARGTERFFLAKRGEHLSGGAGTWAVPGGALDQGETPLDGAMREFREEIKVGDVEVSVVGEHRDAVHEAWAYTTVAVDVPARFSPPNKLDWETAETGWFTRNQVKKLPKHPGLDSAWDTITALYPRPTPASVARNLLRKVRPRHKK